MSKTRAVQIADLPPSPLMVLDSLMDDYESIETMRSCGEAHPHGLALVDESLIVDAVRSLLADGLIEAWKGPPGLVPEPSPLTDEADLRRYWYLPTEAGKQRWREGPKRADEEAVFLGIVCAS